MEIPERAICIVPPESKITLLQGSIKEFITERIRVPDIGIAFVHGYNDVNSVDPGEMGIAFSLGQISIGESLDLTRRGLYVFNLHFIGTPKPPFRLIANMYIPESGLVLQDELFFVGDHESNRDPSTSNNLIANSWNTPGGSLRFRFFVNPNVDELSALRFSFDSDSARQS